MSVSCTTGQGRGNVCVGMAGRAVQHHHCTVLDAVRQGLDLLLRELVLDRRCGLAEQRQDRRAGVSADHWDAVAAVTQRTAMPSV